MTNKISSYRASLLKVIYSIKNETGIITPLILIIASILIIFAVSINNWAVTENKNAIRKIKKSQALQIAEAGVDYYKWHLAHDDLDYKDGNNWCCNEDPDLTLSDCGNICGPYIHEYKDYSGNTIGQFSLKIIPPEVGSTVNEIESTGQTYGNNSVSKKVAVLIGKRSLAEYGFLTNSPLWLGENESISGPIHSNGGIRFDSTANAEVTSAVEEYNCAGTGHGCSGIKPGIWGDGGPTTYWRFPVPAIDFSLFTVSLANIKTLAQEDGIYFDDSGAEGYLVKFLSNATVDIYKINTLENKIWYFNFEQGSWKKEAEEIQNKTLIGNYDMPNNGLIFIEDDVWIEGSINGKVTVAAAKFPENPNNYARIRINSSVQYIARDGNNNLGLIAQGDVLVPRYAPNNLIIDATLLSQKGHVYRREYYYDVLCYWYGGSYCDVKNSIEVYGGIITNLFWTWTWVYWDDGSNEWVTLGGYDNTSTIYNNNLTFSPPPSFPTSENFEVLSWDEK